MSDIVTENDSSICEISSIDKEGVPTSTPVAFTGSRGLENIGLAQPVAFINISDDSGASPKRSCEYNVNKENLRYFRIKPVFIFIYR